MRAAAADALAAQARFETRLDALGAETLAALDPARPNLVLVGRPYNTCDMGVCQNLPFTLRRLDALAIPMDFLPVRQVTVPERYRSHVLALRPGHPRRPDASSRPTPASTPSTSPPSAAGPTPSSSATSAAFWPASHTSNWSWTSTRPMPVVVTRCEAFVESLHSARATRIPA